MESDKNQRGRPSKYDPKYCDKIIEWFESKGRKPFCKPIVVDKQIVDHPLGLLPAFFEGFAASIDVCRETLFHWCKAYPDFFNAYKKCKDMQLEQMQAGMISGVYVPSATIFTLKNTHEWTDRQQHQHSGPGGGPIETRDISKTAEWLSKLSPAARAEVEDAALAD